MTKRPLSPDRMARICSSALCRVTNASCAWRTSSIPAGVRRTPADPRRRSAVPSWASSFLTATLMAGWLTRSRRAAAVMPPASATAAR
jgi:hypothetical protein